MKEEDERFREEYFREVRGGMQVNYSRTLEVKMLPILVIVGELASDVENR